jgi:hypothetical protein
MTWKPEEIVVSDADVEALSKALEFPAPYEPCAWTSLLRYRLAAFLAARMPDRLVRDRLTLCGPTTQEVNAHNSALDAVARGKGT